MMVFVQGAMSPMPSPVMPRQVPRPVTELIMYCMMKVNPTKKVAPTRIRWGLMDSVIRPTFRDMAALQPPEMKMMKPTMVATSSLSVPIICLI